MLQVQWRKLRNFILQKVLHTSDSPERIARGVAVGVFVAFTPTMGAQTFIAIAVAAALRANKFVTIPLVWISNPFTFIPIYWFCWRVGAGLLSPNASAASDFTERQLAETFQIHSMSQLLQWDFWLALPEALLQHGTELWLGCSLVGFVAAILAYIASRRGVIIYRVRRAAKLAARSERRQRRFLRNLATPRKKSTVV